MEYRVGIELRQAQPHVPAPSQLVLFDFQKEYLPGEQRFFAESQGVREAPVAVGYGVVLGKDDVFAVVGVESRDNTAVGVHCVHFVCGYILTWDP